MIEFGTESTIYVIGNTAITKIQKYRQGEETVSIKNFKTRVKVYNSKEEMAEFIKFTDEISKLRAENKLIVDRDDPSTRPAFVIEFPKENIDNGYFVIKCFTILV
jgi:hypothetical protein